MMAHMALNTQPGLAQALASEASTAMQGQLEQLCLNVEAGLRRESDSPGSVIDPRLHWVCYHQQPSCADKESMHAADMCHCLMQAQSCCWRMKIRSTACRCQSRLAMLSCMHALVLPLTGRPSQQRHWPCCMACMHLCLHPTGKPSLQSRCACLPILTMAYQLLVQLHEQVLPQLHVQLGTGSQAAKVYQAAMAAFNAPDAQTGQCIRAYLDFAEGNMPDFMVPPEA